MIKVLIIITMATIIYICIKPMLGTTLPGFRHCNPPWLRLSQRPWDHKPLRRQSLSPWLISTLLYPPCPGAWPVSQWRVRFLKEEWGIPQGEGWPKIDMVMKRLTWVAIVKGGDGTLPLGFDIVWVLILSARSLLISWLPYFTCLT